jgi:hypothetical protein
MDALAKINAGDILDVTILRDGETKVVKVKFE